MTTHSPSDQRTRQIARTLQLDRAAIETLKALSSADVPALLLKGASFRTWLYPREGRAQVDVDVLVPQEQWGQAARVIEGLGFVLDQRGSTGCDWWRASDRTWLDLHYTLRGLGVPATQAWATLWNQREEVRLHGATVQILNERARLVHVVMHAIQTGNAKTKAVADLTRAIENVAFERWQEAWSLAAELQAESRFAASLRLYAPGGAELADRLGAPTGVRWLDYIRAIERAPASAALSVWMEGDWRQRSTLLRRWIWPGTEALIGLERGRFPHVPAWVRHCPSRTVQFYLWRLCQVFMFIHAWPAAWRLRRASDRPAYRHAVSPPWRDDR
jgi:Uncharacterised nucleotidyltransferase